MLMRGIDEADAVRTPEPKVERYKIRARDFKRHGASVVRRK